MPRSLRPFLCAAAAAVVITLPTFGVRAAEDDHAGHDHGEASAAADAGPTNHGDHAGHDHGEAPAAVDAGHADHDDHAGHAGHGHETGHVDEVRLTEQAIAAFNITVAPVGRRDLRGSVDAPAQVDFNREAMAHVGSPVTGRVTTLHVRMGDIVAVGEVIAEVRSPELGQLQAAYLASVNALEAAEPGVEIAQDALDRARQLYDNTQGISLTEVQARQTALRAAQRERLIARSDLDAAANTLRLYAVTDAELKTLRTTHAIDPVYRVRAPIAGEVIARAVTPGELVSPDDDALVVLADRSTAWLLADVAEAQLARVGVGSPATVFVPAVGPGYTEGEISWIDPALNPQTRTARLRMVLENPGGTLRAGMFARVTIGPVPDAARGAGALPAVPASAVFTVEGGAGVFVPVPGEPNTFALRTVTVGPAVGGFVPVHAGLTAGESVVVTGGFLLKADLGKAGAKHDH